MTETIRLAGAQIPVHESDIQFNKSEIIKSLDWAKENNVDVIQTPEGSLSGYGDAWEKNIPELQQALSEIEIHQRKCGVALNLGTLMLNYEQFGALKRNQIRHYDKEGHLYALTNKTYVVNGDGNCIPSFQPVDEFDITYAKHPINYEGVNDFLIGVGMICNDMWGAPQEQGVDYKPIKSLNEILTEKNVDIVFHSTHGYKFSEIDSGADGLTGDSHDYIVRDTFDKWSEAWLQMTAFRCLCSILTVDSCVPWDWDGDENIIDKCKTSSPSGVVNPLGEWMVQAPRYGRQYFHYDYELNTKEKFWKIFHAHTGGDWKTPELISFTKKNKFGADRHIGK